MDFHMRDVMEYTHRDVLLNCNNAIPVNAMPTQVIYDWSHFKSVFVHHFSTLFPPV